MAAEHCLQNVRRSGFETCRDAVVLWNVLIEHWFGRVYRQVTTLVAAYQQTAERMGPYGGCCAVQAFEGDERLLAEAV